MHKLRTYWQQWRVLPPARQRALWRASFCLVVLKLALQVLPFATFRRFFAYIIKSVPGRHPVSERYLDDTVWAVRTAAYNLPISLLCLPQALAVKYLLRGQPGLSLHIGVQQGTPEGFAAHAWVESTSTGGIVIGQWPETVTYRPLWVWS